MLRIPSLPAALVVLLGAGAAPAFTFEFAGFTPSGDEFVGCGLDIQATDLLVIVDEPSVPGLAVGAGPSEFYIDGNDSVRFDFLAGPATNVRYTVSEIVASGGAVIEAYDEELDLIGSVEVSGTGEKHVSALFGFVPLGAFRVTNSVGGHRIGSVTFQPPGGFVTIDMRDAFDSQTPALKHCGVGMDSDGTGDVYASPVTGIGIGGVSAGVLDYFVEAGEALVVELDERAYRLTYSQASNGGPDATVEVTGFGAEGASIGPVTVETAGPVDVSALFLDAPLTGFALAPTAGNLSLVAISFVPEPGAGAAVAAAFAGLATLRARRRGIGRGDRR